MEINWTELDALQDEQVTDTAFDDLRIASECVYVPGEGDNPTALIIGEAPGAHEHVQRRPFVGPAGQAMRDLMAIAGLYADTPAPLHPDSPQPNCWLTNVVKFRPAGNRKPTDAEIAAARPYLNREWRAVGMPQLIIPVGGSALQAFTGQKQSILRAAGKLHMAKTRKGVDLFVWPMVHPSFGIRNPPVRPLLEADWQALAGWLAVAYKG